MLHTLVQLARRTKLKTHPSQRGSRQGANTTERRLGFQCCDAPLRVSLSGDSNSSPGGGAGRSSRSAVSNSGERIRAASSGNRAAGLRKLRSVGLHDQWQMRIRRCGETSSARCRQICHAVLARRSAPRTTSVMPSARIVHHDRELVGEDAVTAANHHIAHRRAARSSQSPWNRSSKRDVCRSSMRKRVAVGDGRGAACPGRCPDSPDPRSPRACRREQRAFEGEAPARAGSRAAAS